MTDNQLPEKKNKQNLTQKKRIKLETFLLSHEETFAVLHISFKKCGLFLAGKYIYVYLYTVVIVNLNILLEIKNSWLLDYNFKQIWKSKYKVSSVVIN